MASKQAVQKAGTVAKAIAGGRQPVSQKQTLQSVGIWERIRRSLAIDPNRSNGVPLNPYFRWPTPGGNDPMLYDDPVTVPAGDIADNPYWKRDTRRNYPRLSVVNQSEAVALLTVGNAAKPKVELIGEEGSKALVAAEAEGEEKGLAKVFEEKGIDVAKELLVDGLPPLPSGQSLKTGQWAVHPWELNKDQSYPDTYPCRTFQ
ncbi:hypothetical protein N0V93_000647 [Gnomoniopsis smithogilvyi]|uniref:NADH dehydrogenase n=1 Tax=Gnomoniopsis smithogilvyi TaxID=1191159 RepID=A0A9W8Z2C9_9PEZI|nr:hypothetical protein N0V93_000647 [Gnomoniopsis smithogilvyi]